MMNSSVEEFHKIQIEHVTGVLRCLTYIHLCIYFENVGGVVLSSNGRFLSSSENENHQLSHNVFTLILSGFGWL